MARHLDLSVQAFVRNVPIDLMERYLERVKVDHVHRDWLHCNADALEHFLSEPKNAEPGALIRADFQRLNDISHDAMGLLVQAFRRDLIPYDGNLPREHLAMLLFLDHPTAFDYAWSRYLLLDSSTRLGLYYLDSGTPEFGTLQKERFQQGARQWFADQAKGEHCDVQFFDDAGETLVRVQRGTYVHTRHYWDGPQISTHSYRPAVEDVLVFEPQRKLLRIKAGHDKDREQYLRLFCRHIVGNEALADGALKTETFSLAPIQQGRFDYGGDGPIARVELRRAKMRLSGVANTVVDIRAEDVREALQYDIPGLSLDAGRLDSVQLRFVIAIPGKRVKRMSVTIEPPDHSNLVERENAGLVMRYLEREGVKLR